MANEIETILRILLDRQAARESESGIDRVEGAMQGLDNAVEAQSGQFQRLSGAIKNTFDTRIIRNIKTTTDAIEGQSRAINDNRERLRLRNEEFDRLSRDVGLAGDVQSNLGAIAGLTSAAGFGGVATGVSVVGEVAALTEELPRLKTALGGISDVARTAIGAIGGRGVGLIGATAALAAAFALATKEAQRRAEIARGVLTAQEEYFYLIQTGTSESIQQEKDELQAELDAARQAQELRERQRAAIREDMNRKFGVFAGFVDEVGIGLGITGGEVQALDEAITKGAADIAEMETRLDTYNRALESGAIKTRDAEEAERKLAEKRSRNALESARQVRQRLEAEQAALDRSFEGNQDRLNAIEDEREVINAQIDTLRRSGSKSEEVQAEIDRLTDRLSMLGDEARFIRDVALDPAAHAAELAAERNEEIRALADKRLAIITSAEEQLADLEAKRADKIIEINENAAEAAEDALRDLRQQRSELRRDLGRQLAEDESDAEEKRMDIRIDAQQEEAKAFRDHLRTLRDIRIDAQRREEDLLFERDFLGLFQLRRDTRRQMQDETRAFSDQRQETRIQLEQQFADVRRNLERQRAERLRQFNQQLADADAAFQQERKLIEQSREEQLQTSRSAFQEELRALRDKASKKLQLLQNEQRNELQLLGQTATARTQIFQQELERIRALGAGIGTPSSSFATFGGGGRSSATMRFRPAATAGIFDNRTFNGGTVNINESRTPQATGEAVRRIVQDEFGRMLTQ